MGDSDMLLSCRRIIEHRVTRANSLPPSEVGDRTPLLGRSALPQAALVEGVTARASSVVRPSNLNPQYGAVITAGPSHISVKSVQGNGN